MRRLIAGLALLALLGHWLPAAAAPGVAARIDGAPLYDVSVDTMWRLALRTEPGVQRQAVRDTMIANRLLARYARRQFGETALTSGARVAFPREAMLDDQLVAALRTVYSVPSAAPQSAQLRPPEAALEAICGKPGKLILDASLTGPQLDAAGGLVLLRYRVPGAPEASVTLADVYRRQNVQGRVAILARDAGFMQQQAVLVMEARQVLAWGAQRFGADALGDLRDALADQADAHALMRMHGVGEEAHGDSDLIDSLARQVSKAEVRSYYLAHREQFVRIERVYAHHIRLADEAQAIRIAALLAGGADFAAAARAHSIAPDAARGGALGWIRHARTPGWLAQLAFHYGAGEISPPVRTPASAQVQAHWEIVLVERVRQGYQRADSESVRYVASRAVARAQAVRQLAALQQRLRGAARIVVPDAGGAS